MTANNNCKALPAPQRTRTATAPATRSVSAAAPANTENARTAPPQRGAVTIAANNRWNPSTSSARSPPNPALSVTPRAPPQSGPPAATRPPRPLASIELFQKAQALLVALPAQPPVLRKEGVELLAALGAGYLNGDAASLIPALTETRARCGRLLALLTALCPAQLVEFETQLYGLHRACGYFIRYLQEQQRSKK